MWSQLKYLQLHDPSLQYVGFSSSVVVLAKIGGRELTSGIITRTTGVAANAEVVVVTLFPKN
jgi:hypothetical protein